MKTLLVVVGKPSTVLVIHPLTSKDRPTSFRYHKASQRIYCLNVYDSIHTYRHSNYFITSGHPPSTNRALILSRRWLAVLKTRRRHIIVFTQELILLQDLMMSSPITEHTSPTTTSPHTSPPKRLPSDITFDMDELIGGSSVLTLQPMTRNSGTPRNVTTDPIPDRIPSPSHTKWDSSKSFAKLKRPRKMPSPVSMISKWSHSTSGGSEESPLAFRKFRESPSTRGTYKAYPSMSKTSKGPTSTSGGDKMYPSAGGRCRSFRSRLPLPTGKNPNTSNMLLPAKAYSPPPQLESSSLNSMQSQGRVPLRGVHKVPSYSTRISQILKPKSTGNLPIRVSRHGVKPLSSTKTPCRGIGASTELSLDLGGLRTPTDTNFSRMLLPAKTYSPPPKQLGSPERMKSARMDPSTPDRRMEPQVSSPAPRNSVDRSPRTPARRAESQRSSAGPGYGFSCGGSFSPRRLPEPKLMGPNSRRGFDAGITQAYNEMIAETVRPSKGRDGAITPLHDHPDITSYLRIMKKSPTGASLGHSHELIETKVGSIVASHKNLKGRYSMLATAPSAAGKSPSNPTSPSSRIPTHPKLRTIHSSLTLGKVSYRPISRSNNHFSMEGKISSEGRINMKNKVKNMLGGMTRRKPVSSQSPRMAKVRHVCRTIPPPPIAVKRGERYPIHYNRRCPGNEIGRPPLPKDAQDPPISYLPLHAFSAEDLGYAPPKPKPKGTVAQQYLNALGEYPSDDEAEDSSAFDSTENAPPRISSDIFILQPERDQSDQYQETLAPTVFNATPRLPVPQFGSFQLATVQPESATSLREKKYPALSASELEVLGVQLKMFGDLGISRDDEEDGVPPEGMI
ncbi:hypothetical protein MKZ38_003831 [Zalerion maritima]|uniref:Uncharacterized protein n=1 Tax=Zalerion maritima TaxID=339359 RepID=A0AAD5WPZ4_9PEZI|nr:hypothetical protein MKZ38_003831 [Zalerion maritima]